MNKKKVLLILGVIFDLVGMLTYLLPGFGEGFDFFWAPLSALALFLMYRGKKGVLGGILGGLEEILPLTDIIPSFTLMWLYTYYFENKEEVKDNQKIKIN